MKVPRAVAAVAAALVVVGLVGLLATGCSKKESAPPPVVKVQPKPPAPAQPAANAAARPAPKKQAQAGGGAPSHKVGESVLYGPGDYLETVVIKAPHYAKDTVSAAYVEHEIKEFHALKGRWPKSLDELGEWAGEAVQKAPSGMKYDYNPKTGVVKVVPAE